MEYRTCTYIYSSRGAFLLFVIMRKVFMYVSRLYRLLLIGV